MTGPTIVTTAATPVRSCWVCGDLAVAGTGVAVARWWCLVHLQVGLANTTVDLAIAREMQGLVKEFSEYVHSEPDDQEESLPWRSESRGDDDQARAADAVLTDAQTTVLTEAMAAADRLSDEERAENRRQFEGEWGRWGEKRHAWTDPTPEQAEHLDAALRDDQEAATA